MKFLLSLAYFVAIAMRSMGYSPVAHQAPHPGPSAPAPTSVTGYQYVLINAADFRGAHLVETERTLPGVTQHLSILNLLVPLQRASSGLLGMAPDLAANSTMLITLAILPDASSGQINWQPLQLDTLATDRRLLANAFVDTCFQRLARYRFFAGRTGEDNQCTRSAQVKPVLYRDGQYWTPRNYTLTEVFLICPLPLTLPLDADNVTINPLARPYSLAHLEQDWTLRQQFHLNGRGPDIGFLLASKLLLDTKHKDGTYDFYTMPANIVDGSKYYSGATKFRYQPGVGLIAGRYQQHLPANSNSTPIPFTTKRIVPIKETN